MASVAIQPRSTNVGLRLFATGFRPRRRPRNTFGIPSVDATPDIQGGCEAEFPAEEPFTDFTANLLDFEGTLTSAPSAAFDLEATYDGGAIRGHGYSTYCKSLSDP